MKPRTAKLSARTKSEQKKILKKRARAAAAANEARAKEARADEARQVRATERDARTAKERAEAIAREAASRAIEAQLRALMVGLPAPVRKPTRPYKLSKEGLASIRRANKLRVYAAGESRKPRGQTESQRALLARLRAEPIFDAEGRVIPQGPPLPSSPLSPFLPYWPVMMRGVER